ncbi:MAG: DUF2065 domain-containing protein [Rhodospirillales bacterium]
MAEYLFTAAGLALALEGALYALFPGPMKRMMARVLTLPESQVRTAGLAAAFAGVGVVWLMLG